MRRFTFSALALALALPFGSTAQAQQLRFVDTAPGRIVAIGNTLGLAKETNLNGPGAIDSIGTFTTLDGTSRDTDLPAGTMMWPLGTTSDWTENGSTATLSIPSEATILYAELVWGGSHEYVEDVTAFLDDPVQLSFGGDTIMVTPDNDTSTTIEETGSFVIRYYMRSGEVTDFIEQHGSGTYAVQGVPGTQNHTINSVNAAGWSLIIAYRYESEPIRNLSVFVGQTAFVDEQATVDYEVSGFCAPPAGEIQGSIAIATLEGDSNRNGDQLAIGQTAGGTFELLSGPNNPENNFFCSQINGVDGLVDTTGSFGMANHTPGSNAVGARQGWDIAHIDLTSMDNHLVPGQEEAVLRTQTQSDSYLPVLAGIAIDVNAPTFLYEQSTTETDVSEVSVGESFVATIKLSNEGTAPAEGVELVLPLAAGLDLAAFTTDGTSGDIDGTPVTLADLTTTGVDMGDLPSGEERVVTVTVNVTAPQLGPIVIVPEWSYAYTMCTGSTFAESFTGELAAVTFVPEVNEGGGGAGGGTDEGGAGGAISDGGSSSGGAPSAGGEGGGKDDGGGEGGGGDIGITPEDGCDCRASAGTDRGLGLGALLLGALAALTRRRKRA